MFFYLSFGERKLGLYGTMPSDRVVMICSGVKRAGFLTFHHYLRSLPQNSMCLLQGSHYEYDAKVIKQVG